MCMCVCMKNDIYINEKQKERNFYLISFLCIVIISKVYFLNVGSLFIHAICVFQVERINIIYVNQTVCLFVCTCDN